ncbi:MAG TPA: class I SAM-dependent methyltransferase [Candidatus Latescibacteria bacterium]|nr:class I SAM-dependent methyltransferase [Candidatus Latescibacterota bacterium]
MDCRTDRTELLEHYRDASNLAKRANLHRDYSTGSRGWGAWLFDHLDYPQGARILEVGCGAGWLWSSTDRPETLGWSPTLYDLSAGMVAEARSTLGSRACFRFLSADSQRLPFPDETFDGLLSCHMLYHVPDRPRAIAEFRRVLRPGGRLMVATNGNRHLLELWGSIAGVIGAPPKVSSWHNFGLENGAGQLAEFFQDVTLARFPDGLVVPEAEPLVDYARSTERLDESQLGRLRDIFEHQLSTSGPIHIQKDSGLFSASKV